MDVLRIEPPYRVHARRGGSAAVECAEEIGFERRDERGTDGRSYPLYDRSQANFVGAQAFDTVIPVGHYSGSASPYGAYDMAGNVMEWCQDWYDRDYYAVSPRKNPKGPATGAYRVLRSGSFFVEAFDLRVTARSMAWPSFQAHRMIGFRPVREP